MFSALGCTPIFAGHKRYAHVTVIRGNGVNSGLLEMDKVISEDALRRALSAIPEDKGVTWLDLLVGNSRHCLEGFPGLSAQRRFRVASKDPSSDGPATRAWYRLNPSRRACLSNGKTP